MLTQPPRQYERLLRRALRLLSWSAAVVGGVMVVGLLVLRFWVWPALANLQPQMIAALEPALAKHGLVLTINSVQADWEDWFTPRIRVNDIVVRQPDREPLLSVSETQATLGLKSIGDHVSQILEQGIRELMLSNEGTDFGQGILHIGIDANERHIPVGVLLRHFLQPHRIQPGQRALGPQKGDDDKFGVLAGRQIDRLAMMVRRRKGEDRSPNH